MDRIKGYRDAMGIVKGARRQSMDLTVVWNKLDRVLQYLDDVVSGLFKEEFQND